MVCRVESSVRARGDMFDLVAFVRQWFGSLTSVRVGDFVDEQEAQALERAYKQYATSERLDTMGAAGHLPTESVNESFFSRGNDLLNH